MVKRNECPCCKEVGTYENRAFKKAKKRRCKNDSCRVMFFKEEESKSTEIDAGIDQIEDAAESLDDLDSEKVEELKEELT